MSADQLTNEAMAIFLDPAQTNKTGNNLARSKLIQATTAEPDHALAHAAFSYVYVRDWESDWGPTPEASNDGRVKAMGEAQEAVRLYEDNKLSDAVGSYCHWVRAIVHSSNGSYGEADADYAKSQTLNPSNFNMLAERGDSLVQRGQFSEAINSIQSAIDGREAADEPVPFWYYWSQARALYMNHQYDEAIGVIGNIQVSTRPHDVSLLLAACYAQRGEQNNDDEDKKLAKSEMKKFHDAEPTWTLADSGRYTWSNAVHKQHWLDGLSLAGLT